MHSYLVQENQKLNDNTLLLTLKRGTSERPLSFQPGQYAAISFYHNKRQSPARCFSIVSSPTDQNKLQFSTRINGRFTRALAQLEPDDIVNVYGPFGGFVFDAEADKKVVFIAGGIGITPFISMMRYSHILKLDNDVNLFYSSAVEAGIPFRDELISIEKDLPNLKTRFVISNGEITDETLKHRSFSGHIDSNLISNNLNEPLEDYKFYICGPPPFMAIIQSNLKKAGIPDGQILTEAFTQATTSQSGILRSWPANVYALGAVSVILGGLVVTASDLLRTLPPTSNALPTKNSPFLITNARQQQLSQIINSISPSPGVITLPSKNQTTTTTSSSSSAATTSSTPPTFAPIYSAPLPTTTPSKIP